MQKVIPCKIDSYKIIWFDSVTSTNDKAIEMALDNAPEGTVIFTDYQTKGKGQRQNNWESEKGKNLTFSIILRPESILAEQQFLLSKVASLAVYDYLKSIHIEARIKWPNDIYIDNKKITGMLIENSLMGEYISFSVAGIGINLNQETFNNSSNPVSIFQLTGKKIDIEEALNNFLIYFDKRYTMLKNKEFSKINNDYFQNLYRAKEFHLYEHNKKIIKAKITGISDFGELILEDENGIKSNYMFKEINFIIS